MVFAKKKWGQNFLVDNNLLEKIIKTIDIKKDDIIIINQNKETSESENRAIEAAFVKIPKVVKYQTERKLTKSRKYLPYIMMLDKFGVPIWYKMAGIGFSAFRPYKNGYYYGAVSNYPQFAIGLGKTVLLDKSFNITGFQKINEEDIFTELHEFQYLDDDTIVQIGSKSHKYDNQNVDSGIISI